MSDSSATIQSPQVKNISGLYFLDIRPIATLGPFDVGLSLVTAQFSLFMWIRFLDIEKGALANVLFS